MRSPISKRSASRAVSPSISTRISARDGFECPYVPESNILCFRWKAGDDDAQDRIRAAIRDQGDAYLSSAVLGGRRFLRMSIMNEDSTEDVVEAMLDRIEEITTT